MSTHAKLDLMKLKGTVKNGVVAVDLPDGTAATVILEDDPGYELDRPVN